MDTRYDLTEKKRIFAMIDSLQDPVPVLLMLKTVSLYEYLLYSLERGVMFKDALGELLSSHESHHGLIMIAFLTVALNPYDEEVVTIVRNEPRVEEDLLDLILELDVPNLVHVISSSPYALQILMALYITSRDVFDVVLSKVIVEVTFVKLFNCVCVVDGMCYTEWNVAIEVAVIKAYYDSLSLCDTTAPGLYDMSRKRLKFLIGREDDV